MMEHPNSTTHSNYTTQTYDRPRNFNTTSTYGLRNNHIRGNKDSDTETETADTQTDYLTSNVFKRRPDLLEEIMKNVKQIISESK